MTGCPLLLACMCVERYVAVARPVLYLRARKWEYKIAISVAVWAVTLIFVVVTVLQGAQAVILHIFVLIVCLFLVMLSCLVGLAWSLGQQSPAHSTALPLASPPKRRALQNVLLVIVPAVVSYLPVVLVVPMATYGQVSKRLCVFMNTVLFFPCFGVFIGPMFYWAKFRQVFCGRKGGRQVGGAGGGGGGGAGACRPSPAS
ncbi:unnamed protein product [Lota lota]